MRSYTNYIAIFFLLSSVLLTGCSKDSPSPTRNYHRIDTHAVTNLSASGVTFNAAIIQVGEEAVIEHGFAWGTTQPSIDYGNFEVIYLGPKTGTGEFWATVEDYDFARRTRYYVRPFVKTEGTIAYGPTVSFYP